MVFARKSNKVPELYMIFVGKCPNFTSHLPEKIFFFGILGARGPLPPCLLRLRSRSILVNGAVVLLSRQVILEMVRLSGGVTASLFVEVGIVIVAVGEERLGLVASCVGGKQQVVDDAGQRAAQQRTQPVYLYKNSCGPCSS